MHQSVRKISLIMLLLSVMSTALLLSCGKPASSSQTAVKPPFSADSAYMYIKDQVSMGARVPGSVAHEECCLYLQKQLSRFCDEVRVEEGEMLNYEGKPQHVKNIVAQFGKEKGHRLLLAAHWDSRPWSDQEEDYDMRREPVPGANDGASGVGVLLEVARQIHESSLKTGEQPAVDIIFFDCEDMGTPDFYTGKQREDTWCLGSQLWAQDHKSESKDYAFGIVLDMVGAPGAVFPKEYVSMQYAQPYVDKVWKAASDLGYGQSFLKTMSYPITDDHYYINTIAGIPCLDIIHYEQGSETGFFHIWHTTKDDLQHIDKTTLDMVGRVVMQVIKDNR